jgi:hypothetical protein
VRTRIKSPQTNGVVERFFGTLKYEHLYRGYTGDGQALDTEVHHFRTIYNTPTPPSPRRPHPQTGLPRRHIPTPNPANFLTQDTRKSPLDHAAQDHGALIFDSGICLVLFALPALAFAVAIQIALGRRKFVPPFVTWFAAMLFAVIPIRNLLSGAPPSGAWMD